MIIVPTLAPGFLLKSGDEFKGQAKYSETVVGDLKKAARLTKSQPTWDESEVWKQGRLFPTVQDVEDFCLEVHREGDHGAASGVVLGADVETTGEHPLQCRLICLGLGLKRRDGTVRLLCVPILSQGGSRYWSPGDEARVFALVTSILTRADLAKVFHNGAFDCAVLTAYGIAVQGWVYDTMQAHHVVDSELPHGLGYVGSTFLDIRYWKDDVKGGEGWLNLTDHTLRSYCLTGTTGVLLEDGRTKPISWLVLNKYAGKVLSADPDGMIRPQSVIGWHRSRVANQQWVAIRRAGVRHPIVVTPDHPIAVWESGVRWKPAAQISTADRLVLPELEFTADQRQALLGTILGDASLSQSPCSRGKPSAEVAAFECVHTNPALVKYKAAFLQAVEEPRLIGTALRLNSMVQLGELRAQTWVRGKRRIPIAWLDELGPRGWAWWFADDGCKQKDKQRSGAVADSLHLALHRYPRVDQLAVRDWFRLQFGACSIQQGSLYMGRIASRRFADFIGPFLPTSVRYKLPRDHVAPAFSDTAQPRTRALLRPVLEAGPHALPRRTRGERYKAETRWCIDVENTHAFFTPQALVHNCLRDVKVTLDILGPLHQRVLQLGLWNLYQQEVALCRLMLRATLRGMLIDTVRRDSRAIGKDGLPEGLGPRLEYKRDLALANLRQIAGSSTFDPQKPAHLQYLLFQQLGFPVVMQTATGIPATNKDALVLLALAADTAQQKDALRQLVDFKSAEKFKSTFVDGLGELADGYFHPSWKMLPVTGRLASSPNFQNLSKLIKRIFAAAPGRKLVGVDLSQAELRYVAYLSGEQSLLSMYKLGVNVHTANVALRLGVRAPAGHKDIDAVTEQYLINAVMQMRGEQYADLPEASKENWKPVRTLIKNDEFGRIYGATDETVFKVVRSKRDPETNALLFPDVQLDEIEAQGVTWKQQRKGLVTWWKNVQRETRQKGYYQCPISGRIQWYRDGFKMNEMLNRPVQSGVASHMNERTLEVQAIFDKETGGECLIVQQVHDAINADSPDGYAKRAGQVMQDTLSRPRHDIPGHPNAVLPVDEITMGTHLDEV